MPAPADPRPAAPGLLPWCAALVLGLLVLLTWDASGLDLWLSRQLGQARGFAWRDAWLLSALMHTGGRWLALMLVLLLALDAWRPLLAGPTRAERRYWLAVLLLTALAVPALKLNSLSSCPWDLAEFGGTALYRSHWSWNTPDGGPGHCFPSGHAVAGYAFLGQVFLWRGTRPRLARGVLRAVLVLGSTYALAQVLRGAHFVSHGLWSAWMCAALATLAQGLRRGLGAACAALGSGTAPVGAGRKPARRSGAPASGLHCGAQCSGDASLQSHPVVAAGPGPAGRMRHALAACRARAGRPG